MTRAKSNENPGEEMVVGEKGHEFWLERFLGWQTDVRMTLLDIARVQRTLLEHEEVVNEHLNSLRAAELDPESTVEECEYYESQLRGYYHRARRRQESLHRALELVLEEYAAIEPVPVMPVVFERTSPLKDRVGEASWESFPASDPPSY